MFFVAFIKSYLSWQFHSNYSNYSQDMKIFSFNINYFHPFFFFFDISCEFCEIFSEHLAAASFFCHSFTHSFILQISSMYLLKSHFVRQIDKNAQFWHILKAVFYKRNLVHSWIPWPIYTIKCRTVLTIVKKKAPEKIFIKKKRLEKWQIENSEKLESRKNYSEFSILPYYSQIENSDLKISEKKFWDFQGFRLFWVFVLAQTFRNTIE